MVIYPIKRNDAMSLFVSGDFPPKEIYKKYTSADGWRFHKKNKRKSRKKK